MSGTEQQRERVRQTLTEHVGAAEAERITALAATSVALSTHSEAGAPLGVSRFGGDALLPPDTTWPEHESRALELLAVLDLTALAPLNPELPLPHHGVLNLFYIENLRSGDSVAAGEYESCRVVRADPETAVRSTPPRSVQRHRERALYGRESFTIPDFEDVVYELTDLSDTTAEAYDVLDDAETEPRHRIGGWPKLVQNPVLDDSGEVHLLAQLDSDDRMDWCWGDSGSLYFLIEEQALKAGDFSRVRLEMQCC
ncbi:YwqG family protein [Actinopolyspora sp. H202]|uniref:YwqG family protein n=1 Tax=Actinopolyspora sp. H202 TaxID=1500456 RepID=UPI003EE43619